MPNRELLMLAKDFDAEKHFTSGWYVSEKLDGVRAFWDGGLTTNKHVDLIPWANTEKKNRTIQYSTGLWSRYGNIICAPTWFIDGLPKGQLLDGELWLNYRSLEALRSIVSRHEPTEKWLDVTYNVFDAPSLLEFCQSGRINNPNFTCNLTEKQLFDTFNVQKHTLRCPNFHETQLMLPEPTEHLKIVEQTVADVDTILETVLQKGGEGVVLRDPRSYWTPYRTNYMLRVKPHLDTEAIIVGYNGGTDGNIGRLGSLIVNWNGMVFNLSGFTNDERYVKQVMLFQQYQGKQIPLDEKVESTFALGERITFRYNGLTNTGCPREARYWRKRPLGE